MAHRKLQQEVDRVFKKINEGLDVFDMYYERHESCTNNPSQKEKLEADLKREVKKLQRLREQIKSWQSSPEIKDKDSLLENRRRVEIAMEQYKAVEKASKEKAYSNISLKRTDNLDPEERERQEIETFLSQTIDELDRQYESLEVDIDRLLLLNKKKKTFSKSNEEKIETFKKSQSRYRWHQQQCELALRLLANEELSPQKVNNIKEDINYFVDSNQDDDFIEDETIYDDLDLQSNEAIAHEVSQYFARQSVEDSKATEAATNATSTMADTSTSYSLEDSSKLSKKELRKLEREAKKAAKLAAKNAAALTASQGATITIKMGSKPLSPLPSPTPLNKDDKENQSSEAKNTDSPTQIKMLEKSPSKTSLTSNTAKSPTTVSSTPNEQNQTTHIPSSIGITLKPAPLPTKPVTEMKWSVAASQNLKKDEERSKSIKQPTINTPLQSNDTNINSITSPSSSVSTPRTITTPLVQHNPAVTVANNATLDKMGPLETLSKINRNSNNSNDSAATAAAVLAAGAAAVNQNNQQFHKPSPSPVSIQDINNNKKSKDITGYNTVVDSIRENHKQEEQNKGIKEDDIKNVSEIEEDIFDYALDDDDYITNEPEPIMLTEAELKSQKEKREALQKEYDDDYELLSIPNGINEFIMGNVINNNKLYANDGKLGGYRHSVDLCRIEKLFSIPNGVNPPNPLDAFRSTQQWDIVRSTIGNETNFDSILERFKGLEMFSLFYNYYFAVLPIEKKIAFNLLKAKDWKISLNQTMWFLRQGDIKIQDENFEIADYKIFKLDDWSVVDKLNFRLDYSNLKHPSEMVSNNINITQQQLQDTGLPRMGGDEDRELSHGQQLLQQLKQGKVDSIL